MKPLYLTIPLIALALFGCGNKPQTVKNKSNYNYDTLTISYPEPVYVNGHRKHVLGMTFTTSPPIYSCVYCHNEMSPYQFLPDNYSKMSVPMLMGKDTLQYMNGYYKFTDSLRKAGINDDEWFINEWNKADTSCISNEIAVKKSSDIWHNWLKTHPKGRYYIDKYSWMDTDGFTGGEHDTINHLVYAMGGRFDDSTLLTDEWFKIIYDSVKTKP